MKQNKKYIQQNLFEHGKSSPKHFESNKAKQRLIAECKKLDVIIERWMAEEGLCYETILEY